MGGVAWLQVAIEKKNVWEKGVKETENNCCIKKEKDEAMRKWRFWRKIDLSVCVFKVERLVCLHAHSLQSCLTLCNPINCSPPGSSVHGILQAKILEWVAVSSTGDLPQPGIQPTSPALQAHSLPLSHQGSPRWKYLNINFKNRSERKNNWLCKIQKEWKSPMYRWISEGRWRKDTTSNLSKQKKETVCAVRF